ncbi:MAG: glycosyltransferase [Gammaproteobacteria bacterium]
MLPSLGLGGAERQAFLLAQYLRQEERADVRIVAMSRHAARTDSWDEAGLPYEFFDMRHAYRSRLGHAQDLLRFTFLLRRRRPQIVLPYCMFQNVLGGLTWRAAGARVCIWNQRDEGRSRLDRWIERLAVSQIRRFISNSHHGADFLTQRLHVRPDKISVVANGVEFPPATAACGGWRRRLGLPADAFLACMVANLHSKKDHATLVAAWRLVVDRCPPGISPHLVLAGSFGDRYEALRQQVSTLSLEKHVHFLGEVREVGDLLADVDLAVFSSFSEGVPNAVLEAMAQGLAVVATDYEGIREAVGPEGAALLAPPRDPAHFAEKVLMVAADVPLRACLGARARDRVTELFGVGRMAAETASVIAAEWFRASSSRLQF